MQNSSRNAIDSRGLSVVLLGMEANGGLPKEGAKMPTAERTEYEKALDAWTRRQMAKEAARNRSRTLAAQRKETRP